MRYTYLTFGIVSLISLVGFQNSVTDQTFTVTNTNDSGDGSLRWAIEQANISIDRDTIEFNIPYSDPGYDDITGVWTIQPSSVLPIIPRLHPIFIDGYTQPGAQPNTNPINQSLNTVLKIELDGSNAGAAANGLVIISGSSTVRGLVINRFDGNGILLTSNASSVIEGNFIGIDASGLINLGNGQSGICIHNSLSNTVGPYNLVSFNGVDGMYISGDNSDGNVVDRNMITENTRDGLRIEDRSDLTKLTNNIILRNTVGIHDIHNIFFPAIENNLIEDNTEAGICIEDGGGVLAKVNMAEYATWENNVITFNLTGIYVRPLSHPINNQYRNTLNITYNSIHSNTNYGLVNEDSTVTVTANDNWWGDASGPFDEDTNPDGQGNAIAGNIICDDWWSDILSISPVANVWDTAGSYVFVDFQIINLDYSPHTFDMTVTDSLDWYCLPNDFSFLLKAMTDIIKTIMVMIPPEAEIGTENSIVLSGTSTQDPAIFGSGEATVSVVVMVSVRGDLNLDGAVNILDTIRIVNIILEVGESPTDIELWAADCNNDGELDILDVVGIVNLILGVGECDP